MCWLCTTITIGLLSPNHIVNYQFEMLSQLEQWIYCTHKSLGSLVNRTKGLPIECPVLALDKSTPLEELRAMERNFYYLLSYKNKIKDRFIYPNRNKSTKEV